MTIEVVVLSALAFALGLKWPKQPAKRLTERERMQRQMLFHLLAQRQQMVRPPYLPKLPR